MKAIKLATMFALVAAIFCGGQPQAENPPATPPTETADMGAMPAVAFEKLTEPEMQKFVAVLPGVAAALKAAGYAPEEKEGEEVSDALARVVGGMGTVAGVEDALKKGGTSWAEFSPTMHKVMVASAAIGLDMAVAMAEGMADDTEEGKQMKAELDKAKVFCGKVPKENKDLVIKNMDKLEALGDLN